MRSSLDCDRKFEKKALPKRPPLPAWVPGSWHRTYNNKSPRGPKSQRNPVVHRVSMETARLQPRLKDEGLTYFLEQGKCQLVTNICRYGCILKCLNITSACLLSTWAFHQWITAELHRWVLVVIMFERENRWEKKRSTARRCAHFSAVRSAAPESK